MEPILLIGGSGVVGRWTARSLRRAHPEWALRIGGRDLAKARLVADEVGNAQAVRVDLGRTDLGLGDQAFGAVVILLKDDTLAALKFAQLRRVPHLGISSGSFEIAPEVSAFIHQPSAAPVVLGSEWLAGAATLPTLYLAKKFVRLDEIRIDALLDEQDIGGPAAELDMHRLTELAPAALTRREGAFFWRVGDEAKVPLRAVDGTSMQGFAYSPFDIAALAAATDAPNVQLNVAVGVSSSRRRGQPMSSELTITLVGQTRDGETTRERHAVVHPEGQAPLTALGITMMLEGVIGKAAGLYLPEQLIEPDAYIRRLVAIGGSIEALS
ncbi:MAG: NAD(P)-dependent oxidoreductase [Polyangiales bacterium]